MEAYFVYSTRAPRITSLWYGSLYQVKWTLLPEFFKWGLADCLLYLGLMISRKPKFSQTYLPQYHFVYHKLYAEYSGTEPRLPSWKAGDWLSVWLPFLSKCLSVNSLVLSCFFRNTKPKASSYVMTSKIIVSLFYCRPSCNPLLYCFVLQHTSRKFAYPRFQPGIEVKVDAGRCCLSSHRYFYKPSKH